jgi:hypothetical protein
MKITIDVGMIMNLESVGSTTFKGGTSMQYFNFTFLNEKT